MDIFDYLIYFTIIYNIALFGCIFTIIIGVIGYVFGFYKNDEFYYFMLILSILTFGIVGLFLFPYLLIVIFDLIMYIFYIIITTIIPETGFPTLFIPVRELLMQIPPLKRFEDRGIFRLFTGIFEYIGGKNSFTKRTKKFLGEYYLFSKDNTYDLIKLYNPHVNVEKLANIVENMNNNNKKEESNNITNDIEVCTGNESKLTTPDMNYTSIFKNNISDMKSKFKCNLNTIPAYIGTI